MLWDTDYIDVVTGETLLELRQYGIIQEHDYALRVEMGLILDRQGLPITMSLHPGNTNEPPTAIPLDEEMVKSWATLS